MTYSPREALAVALASVGPIPLQDASRIALEAVRHLKSLGFDVVQVNHTRDLDGARRAYETGHPAIPPRCDHLFPVPGDG